jgi:membrane-associated phospholipid phosphatase
MAQPHPCVVKSARNAQSGLPWAILLGCLVFALRAVPVRATDFAYTHNAILERVAADETGTSVPGADDLEQQEEPVSTAEPSSPANQAPPADEKKARLCMFCREYGHLLGEDIVHVFKQPTRWGRKQWKQVGIGAGIVVGTAVLLDRHVNNYAEDNQTNTTNQVANTFAPFGADDAFALVAGFYLGGAIAHNERAKAVALDGIASSVITSAMIVPALKVIAGRERPRANQGADAFFQGGASFPSGHTGEAFTLAATIASHYDSLWIKGTAYGVASLVGYARIEQDAHFLSDVVASALIGIGVAKSVVAFNKRKRGALTLRPAIGPDHWGLELAASF